MFNFRRSAKKRWLKYYEKSKWPVIVDIASVFAVFGLLILFLSLYFYNPSIFIGPDFNREKPEKDTEQETYVIDFDKAPLETEINFKTSNIGTGNSIAALDLNIKNNSPLEIKDLKIKFSSVESNLKIRDIYPEEEVLTNLEFLDNEIKLASLKNNESFIAPLNFQFYWDDFGGQSGDIKIEIEYLIKDQTIKKTTYIKSPRVESSLKAKAFALYTGDNGDKLGLGPIPPVASLPTNYWLFFETDNSGDLKNFIMSARLAQHVNLNLNYALLDGDFSYDSDTRLIIWKIDDLKDGEEGLRFGAEIQFIPSENQIGLSPNLLEKIEYSAYDNFSGKTLSGKLSDITTDLVSDKFNKNLGEVRSFDEY